MVQLASYKIIYRTRILITKERGLPTTHKGMALKAVTMTLALCEEYIGFVEEQDTLPQMGVPKDFP